MRIRRTCQEAIRVEQEAGGKIHCVVQRFHLVPPNLITLLITHIVLLQYYGYAYASIPAMSIPRYALAKRTQDSGFEILRGKS